MAWSNDARNEASLTLHIWNYKSKDALVSETKQCRRKCNSKVHTVLNCKWALWLDRTVRELLVLKTSSLQCRQSAGLREYERWGNTNNRLRIFPEKDFHSQFWNFSSLREYYPRQNRKTWPRFFSKKRVPFSVWLKWTFKLDLQKYRTKLYTYISLCVCKYTGSFLTCVSIFNLFLRMYRFIPYTCIFFRFFVYIGKCSVSSITRVCSLMYICKCNESENVYIMCQLSKGCFKAWVSRKERGHFKSWLSMLVVMGTSIQCMYNAVCLFSPIVHWPSLL